MKPGFFTASDIARCLVCTAQNVRKALHSTVADGKKIVSGVETAAWHFHSLPTALIAQLAKAAGQHGFPTPLLFLQNAPRKEERGPSLAHVADSAIEQAQRLQRALGRCLADPSLPIAELARIAADDYRREFGYAVSDRHLRGLISRTIGRDRGHGNFSKLDLYLAARPEKRFVRPSPLARAFRFDELDAHFATLRDRTAPTCAEIAHSWREVIRLVADRLTTGADETKLKRELRAYLRQAAPFMGESDEAIKRAMNRKLRDAIDRGGIDRLTDRRLQRPPTCRPAAFEEAIKLLAGHALRFCSGRSSQAYRQLHMGTTHNGETFSDEFRASFPFDCRRAKSRMPRSVRDAVRPMIAATRALHLGPRAARLAMPSIHRDWSEVLAGDSYTSDDVTINHYVVDWHEEGEYEFDGRRFNVVRPQFLPVVDERTGNPLGFSLIPAPTYNSWHIKTLTARVCMRPEIGLPFVSFIYEGGIWRARNVLALTEWASIDESFGRQGIRLAQRHATTPKAKIIEGVIGALQNLDEYAAGYCGRNEQSVKHERLRAFLQRLKRVGQPQKAELDPRELLMTTEQCCDTLAAVMRRFADEPQNGERLHGISPAEGWEQLSGGRLHDVLPESLRYLLATAESKQRVTNEGICLTIGSLQHRYCGAGQLGGLLGEKVQVRYNPELPEQVTVSHIASDPNAQRPFSVPLFEKVRAHGASSEDFRRARADQAKFTSYGRALYRELVPRSNRTIQRADLGSQELRAAGHAHNQLERELIELKTDRETDRGAIERLAKRQNLAIDPAKVRQPQRVAQKLREMEDLKAQLRALEAAESSQGEEAYE